MIDVRSVRQGNLLIYKNLEICCVVAVKRNRTKPERNIIVAVDNNENVYEGCAEDWYYLWARHALE